MNVLVRKEYRKQQNREAVAAAMVEDMRDNVADTPDEAPPLPTADLDEDWLNVFERYAEDASSERLQGLWGRVLAGELRKPGRFSTRTLRFLSEFSQADALAFETFARFSFGDAAPRSLVRPDDKKDIRDLIYLEACGLIQGSSGAGLSKSYEFNENCNVIINEDDIYIVFKGQPHTKISRNCLVLTPLGQELLLLLKSRSVHEAARAVALAWRGHEIYECFIGFCANAEFGKPIQPMEIVWLKDVPGAPTIGAV